jgi:hypothetical protein
MPYTHFFSSIPDLARANRSVLWAKSVGIWIGLALAALIFGGVVSIVTLKVAFIGQAIEFVLGWGGLLIAVLSILNVFYTLYRLHIESIVDVAIREDRAKRRPSAS